MCATSVEDDELSDCAVATVAAPPNQPPVLDPGVWANITPPYADPAQSTSSIAMDPSNPRTLYVAANLSDKFIRAMTSLAVAEQCLKDLPPPKAKRTKPAVAKP